MYLSNFLYQHMADLYSTGVPRSNTKFQCFWPDIHTGRDHTETEELAGELEDARDDSDPNQRTELTKWDQVLPK